MPFYLILLLRILLFLFNCDPDSLLKLFPRDGLIALLAALLALFVPIAILIVERSKNDNVAFPWEEEMTILQIAHPKILIISIICASLSCVLWNEIIAKVHILPLILIVYIVCIILMCWILYELYKWLLSIVSKKRSGRVFRSKQIAQYFKSIETDREREQVWKTTLDKIELSTPEEQRQLIDLYVDALRRHADDISYFTLVQTFTDNIPKLDMRDLQPILGYSLASITSKETSLFHKAMDEKLLLAILNTIKSGNIFVMDSAYDIIQKCQDSEQSHEMTKKLASKFFGILAQEEYTTQNSIIDAFSVSYKWNFCHLIDKNCNEKIYKQTCVWLSGYIKWLVDQYIKQFDVRETPTSKYYISENVDKLSIELFRDCNIDLQMFADIILLYCPVNCVPQHGESDAEAYIRAFTEKALSRNFMNQSTAEGNDKQAKTANTIKLLSIVAPLRNEGLDTYLDAIDSFKKKLAEKQNEADYTYKMERILRLERYFRNVQNKSK